jgi:uncharacterized membrane protein YecN with MAPEG domain
MPMPQITAFYAALLGLLVMSLGLRVVHGRWTRRIGIGDGGDSEMVRRIRAHANLIENVPLALLLLLLLELTNLESTWLHLFGIALLVGRLLHAWGLSHHAGTSFGRMVGTLLTWLAILAMCVLLLWRWFLSQTL